MWYHAGWFDGTSYAQSKDGIHWNRLEELTGAPDSQVVRRGPCQLRDGCAVWLDHAAPVRSERFKMLIYFREYAEPIRFFEETLRREAVDMYAQI